MQVPREPGGALRQRLHGNVRLALRLRRQCGLLAAQRGGGGGAVGRAGRGTRQADLGRLSAPHRRMTVML
jgi:hypothetical protein